MSVLTPEVESQATLSACIRTDIGMPVAMDVVICAMMFGLFASLWRMYHWKLLGITTHIFDPVP
jgi:hypothetical protein